MPRYHFHIRSGDQIVVDPKGRELPGLKAAHWAAMRLAHDVLPHLPELDDWLIDIADEFGRVRETFVPNFMRCQRKGKTSDDQDACAETGLEVAARPRSKASPSTRDFSAA